MLEYLQQLGQAILDFFEFIGKFISDLAAGVSYVSDFLLDAPDQIRSVLSILPYGMTAAIMGLVSIIITLAVVRWIS